MAGTSGIQLRGPSLGANARADFDSGAALDLEIYGGNPLIVASYEEMQRVSAQLYLAAARLENAVQQPQQVFFDLIPNPIPQLQLAFMVPGLVDRIRALAMKTKLAAEGYFSTEAQILLGLEQVFVPIRQIAPLIADPNPLSQAAADVLTKTAAAFAVIGLTGKPSLATTTLVSSATSLAITASGYRSPSHMLGTMLLTQRALGVEINTGGSASLVKINQATTATSMQEHAKRLKDSYVAPESSIRVQVFAHGAGRQFVVYVPGTQSASFTGNNPLNLSSNLTAMAGIRPSPTENSIQDALSQLKAGEGDRVLFVGHSQGALVTGNLAANNQPYQVSGLISFGGPISHLNLQVPTIAISHQGDPVSVLGGGVNPMRENWVTVSAKGDFEDLVDAHRMASYLETAEKLDLSSDPGFRRVQGQIWQDPGVSGLEYVFQISRN